MAIICWSICACPALTILPLQGPREQSRPVSLEVGNAMKQAPGDGEGQGGLMCCSPWGCKELGTTERLTLTYTYLLTYMYRERGGERESE